MDGAVTRGRARGRSGIFQLAVEVTARPAKQEKDEGESGGAGRCGEGGGLPALIEVIVEADQDHANEPDEPDQRAARHNELAECFTLALARETGHPVGESGHVRGEKRCEKSDFSAAPSNENLPAEGYLLQESDGERVFVFLAVARFDRADDHEDDPRHPNGGGQKVEEDPDQENKQHGADREGRADVDGKADLEIQHFFADAVEIGAVAALDQPEDEGPEDVSVKRENEPRKAEEMHDHGKGVVAGGRRWDGGGMAFGDRRRRVFHGGEIGFWGGGVNEETAESAEGAEREVECEFLWL